MILSLYPKFKKSLSISLMFAMFISLTLPFNFVSANGDNDSDDNHGNDDAPSMCVIGDSHNDNQKVEVMNLNNEPVTLQDMLDNITHHNVDVTDDQKNYQLWNALHSGTLFEVAYEANGAGGPIVFGYHLAGDPDTFTPLFKTGDYAGFETVATRSVGDKISFDIIHAGAVAFAIKSNDTGQPLFSTENSINEDGFRHAVVYDYHDTSSSSLSYIIGFEDLNNLGDHDFNDIVLKVTVLGCDDEDNNPPPPPANHPPVINLIGDNPITALESSVFIDPGATATDTEDGNLTAQIIKTGKVNTSIPGNYTLTYSVTDSAGASASTNRTVIVISTSDCEVIITSDTNTKLSSGEYAVITYSGNPRWTADIPGATWIWKSFYVEYPEQDEFVTFEREFNLSASTTVAILEVAADNSYTINVNGAEIGGDSTEFNYFDEEKDTYNITNFLHQGQNQISFNVKNWGFEGATPLINPAGLLFKLTMGLQKTGCIIDNNAPTIHIIGDNPLNLFVGDTFTDPGATATDTEDGDLTAHIVITGSVNTSTTSTSTLVYSVTDSGGLSTTTSRMVIVLATTTATTTPPLTPPVTPPSAGGGGGGSGSSSIGGHRRDISNLLATTTTRGQVLGATSCSYLKDYLRRDWNNDPIEILKLQSFLNVFEKEKLSFTSVFDEATFQAVSRFQNKYFNDILAPWGHTAPTGFVYLLTKKKINEIYCNTIYPLTPEQQKEIVAFKSYLQSIRDSQGQLPDVSKTVDVSEIDDSSTALENEPTDSGILSSNILRNAAVSFFALPGNLPKAVKGIAVTLIILAFIYALISLFAFGKKEKEEKDKKDGKGKMEFPDKQDTSIPAISYDKSLEELVDDIVRKEELKEVLEDKEKPKNDFKNI